jgi:hypothetical protein
VRNITPIISDYIVAHEKVQIVSGGARGADALGEKLAKELDLPCKIFPANWDVYGRSAGYKRNRQMAEYADMLIAFWDGKSKGTEHMINLAREYDLDIEIIRY